MQGMKTALLLLAAFAVICALLGGSALGALLAFAFIAAIFAPAWLLLANVFRRLGVGDPLASIAGAAFAWVALCFVFLLRKFVPSHMWSFDASIAVILFACGAKMLRSRKDGTRTTFFERADIPWLLIVLPLMFFLPRLGNEVRAGAEVRYFGLFFVDFGNLRAVVNGLNASPGMPLASLDGLGPMSYHWLFFAVPAWMSTFLGARIEASGPLTLATFVAAVLFFKALSASCATMLRETGRGTAKWCAWGAGIGVCCLSVLYFYSSAVHALGSSRFTMGYRNHLLLQLPNSLNVFGNNTFALALVLVAVLALVEWNRRSSFACVIVSALAVGFLPGFSATLVAGLALGIGAACLFRAVRRPLAVLIIFGVSGAGMMAVFGALSFFSGRAEKMIFSFDRGQFLQNGLFGFFLAFLGLVWCLARARGAMTSLCTCIFAATVAVPSFLVLDSGAAATSALSIKTASLILAICALPSAVLISDCWKTRTGPAWLQWVVALLVVGGGINTAAYVVSMPASRFRGGRGAVQIPADYFDALTYVRASTHASALIIDPLSSSYQAADPTAVIAARRTVLSTAYWRLWGMASATVEEREKAWSQWEQSAFSDEKLAEYFAIVGDRLLLRADLQSASWALDTRIGDVRVYRSLLRR